MSSIKTKLNNQKQDALIVDCRNYYESEIGT